MSRMATEFRAALSVPAEQEKSQGQPFLWGFPHFLMVAEPEIP